MRAVVVYESMYGNTAAIADAIAAGLDGAGAAVTLRNVDDVTPADAASSDVLVVGGPTHAHGMTRASTRATALQDAANAYRDPTSGSGLRDWLGDLLPANGRSAAAFDTRVDIPPILSGAASKGIEGELRKRGFRSVVPRESFFVTKENALVPGELERARRWGGAIAAAISVRS